MGAGTGSGFEVDPTIAVGTIPTQRFGDRLRTIALATAVGLRVCGERRPHEACFAGLTEGSLIGEDLVYPGADGEIAYDVSRPGEVTGYDFNRERLTIGGDCTLRRVWTGRLACWALTELEGVDPSVLTPAWAYRAFAPASLKSQSWQTPAQLVARGFLKLTTQQEGYERAGRADVAALLAATPSGSRPAYLVTPKGNTLVCIHGKQEDSADQSREETMDDEGRGGSRARGRQAADDLFAQGGQRAPVPVKATRIY